MRSKIFKEVNIEESVNSFRVNVLLQHMHKWYKKVEMSAMYEACTRFDSYRKEKEVKCSFGQV